MENALLESQIKHLERRINLLAILCGFLLITLAVIIVGSLVTRVNAAEDTRVLRLKGLIIEDENGHARILLGSPLPMGDGSVSPDAWGAIVDDATGFAGTAVNYPPEGTHDQEAILIGTQGAQSLYDFQGSQQQRTIGLRLDRGTPSFQVFDDTGKPSRDLLHPSVEATYGKH